MDPTIRSRPRTFRVENVPPGTTAEGLKKLFYTEDQPYIEVRSIAPAGDNYDSNIQEYTATVSFSPPNEMVPTPRMTDDTMSVDSDFHGFTPLNHPQEPVSVDVVAVTGLAAHAFGSWAHSPQNMWLRDYLPRDISNARILIYGYPSQLQDIRSRSIFSDHSTNFIHRLLAMRESAQCQNRPLVFIGHSLGCLIIKKALCDINGTVGRYSSRLPVRSIIFLGAPHKGLNTSALETLVLSKPTEDMVRELRAESPTLTELNHSFRFVAENIDILTCYELKKTRTAMKMPDGSWQREGPEEMMVSLDSARQWYRREQLIACNADHSQIAKIKRGESGIYPDIKRAIRQAMLSVGDLYSEAGDQYIVGSVSAANEPTEAMRTPGMNLVYQPSEPLENRLDFSSADQSYSETAITTDRDVSQSRSGLRDQEGSGAYTRKSPSIISEPTRTAVNSGVHEDQDGSSRPSPANEKKCTVYDRWLKAAIKGGDLKKMHELLSKVYDINCTDEDARTPLHDAVQWRAEPIVEYLLQHGALSSAKTKSGDTPLHCINNDKASTTPLTESMIDILLRYRPPFKERNKEWQTPLMLAAYQGELLMARKLIHHGARVNQIDDYGQVALHYASKAFNAPDMITLLIREGAGTDSKDYDSRRPLHTAASRPDDAVEAARCLLEAGANIEAGNFKGSTPLHTAVVKGNFSIAKLLLAHGANPLARTKFSLGEETVMERLKGGLSSGVKKTDKELLEMENVLEEAEDDWMKNGKKCDIIIRRNPREEDEEAEDDWIKTGKKRDIIIRRNPREEDEEAEDEWMKSGKKREIIIARKERPPKPNRKVPEQAIRKW